ncbi:MAG TPA: hypothetical protein VII56_17650 [Rhizomicrobium sp.]
MSAEHKIAILERLRAEALRDVELFKFIALGSAAEVAFVVSSITTIEAPRTPLLLELTTMLLSFLGVTTIIHSAYAMLSSMARVSLYEKKLVDLKFVGQDGSYEDLDILVVHVTKTLSRGYGIFSATSTLFLLWCGLRFVGV